MNYHPILNNLVYMCFRLPKVGHVFSSSCAQGHLCLWHLKVMFTWVSSKIKCTSLGFGSSRFWWLTGWESSGIFLPSWNSISSFANEVVGHCIFDLHIFVILWSIFTRAVVCNIFLCSLAPGKSVVWKPTVIDQKQLDDLFLLYRWVTRSVNGLSDPIK